MSRSDQDGYARNQANTERLERRKAHIRYYNDQLRRRFAGGRVMITPGVRALPSDVFAAALRRVCEFTDFNTDNDPHDEQDFGAIELPECRVFWKIDCYDKQLEYGSPDPADPNVTARVLTIMLAEEY